jgi:hypothetical protein
MKNESEAGSSPGQSSLCTPSSSMGLAVEARRDVSAEPAKVRYAGGVEPSAPIWSQRSHHQNSGWVLRHSVWRSRFSPIMMPKRMLAFRSPLLHI